VKYYLILNNDKCGRRVEIVSLLNNKSLYGAEREAVGLIGSRWKSGYEGSVESAEIVRVYQRTELVVILDKMKSAQAPVDLELLATERRERAEYERLKAKYGMLA
jgi:hypothetical protein